MPVKVLNQNGSGTHSNIAAGIVWAANSGADVINMSIAGPRATAVMANAVAYARREEVFSTWDDDGSRDEEFWAEAGWYVVTISQWSDHWTEYRVRVN